VRIWYDFRRNNWCVYGTISGVAIGAYIVGSEPERTSCRLGWTQQIEKQSSQQDVKSARREINYYFIQCIDDLSMNMLSYFIFPTCKHSLLNSLFYKPTREVFTLTGAFCVWLLADVLRP